MVQPQVIPVKNQEKVTVAPDGYCDFLQYEIKQPDPEIQIKFAVCCDSRLYQEKYLLVSLDPIAAIIFHSK